jgi:hypothetical protein
MRWRRRRLAKARRAAKARWTLTYRPYWLMLYDLADNGPDVPVFKVGRSTEKSTQLGTKLLSWGQHEGRTSRTQTGKVD